MELPPVSCNSEFYSNHSVYDVSITVPDNYVVGSGGMLISEADVQMMKNTKHSLTGQKILSILHGQPGPVMLFILISGDHVKITLLIPPEREDQVGQTVHCC